MVCDDENVVFTLKQTLLSVETTLAEALFLCRSKCRNDQCLGQRKKNTYWSKVPKLKWIRIFATGTTLEIFHEAGKHPDVMEILNICVIIGRMDGRNFLINLSGTPSRPVYYMLYPIG
jgi:hypothetical protein